MKPNTSEQGEEGAGEMLNETEQFIEKIEAVEKDRKESQSSVAVADTPDIEIVEVTETASIAESSGVEIFVQRPSVTENDVEDDVKSIKSAKEDLENVREDGDEDSKSIKFTRRRQHTRSIKSKKSHLDVVMCWVFLILSSPVTWPRAFSSVSISCSIFFSLRIKIFIFC